LHSLESSLGPLTQEDAVPKKRIGPRLPEGPRDPNSDLFEQYAGLGSETVTRRDHSWTGDDGELDPDQLSERLVKLDGLGLLLQRMAGRFESTIPPAERGANALFALQGQSPSRGPKPVDRWPILVEIATEYFDATHRPDERGTHLDTIIWTVLLRAGTSPELDPEARGNAITPYRKAFNEHKDRLVALVTGTGSDAMSEQEWHIAQILRHMEKLGLPSAPGSVTETPNYEPRGDAGGR
jgi:hypothetical protein